MRRVGRGEVGTGYPDPGDTTTSRVLLPAEESSGDPMLMALSLLMLLALCLLT